MPRAPRRPPEARCASRSRCSPPGLGRRRPGLPSRSCSGDLIGIRAAMAMAQLGIVCSGKCLRREPTKPLAAKTRLATATPREVARPIARPWLGFHRLRARTGGAPGISSNARPARWISSVRLQRGESQLVDPHGPGERIRPQFRDNLGSSDDDAALRSAEQLVAAEEHQIGAGPQAVGDDRFIGQSVARSDRTGSRCRRRRSPAV